MYNLDNEKAKQLTVGGIIFALPCELGKPKLTAEILTFRVKAIGRRYITLARKTEAGFSDKDEKYDIGFGISEEQVRSGMKSGRLLFFKSKADVSLFIESERLKLKVWGFLDNSLNRSDLTNVQIRQMANILGIT